MSVRTAAVVPAAGRSQRFGSMKLLANVAGQPLLNHTLSCLLDAGLERIVVVLAPGAELTVVTLLRHPRVVTLENPDPSRGMFSSIQIGLAAADAATVLVLPADMPFVSSATVSAVVAESVRAGAVVIPAVHDDRGHPVALPGRIRDRLLTMDPTMSLKEALARTGVPIQPLVVEDAGILRDVDIPSDLDIGGAR